MQIRCYRCGWSFAIKKEEAAFALQALEETGGSHYDTNCPRCRHSNRISLEQLKKAAPRSDGEPTAAEAPEVAKTDSEEKVLETAEAEQQDAGEIAEADRELEADIAKPETGSQEAQAQPEKNESKRRRRKRG
jgi:phage FluMu protein Com